MIVKEGTGAVYTATLKDSAEVPIPKANITTIKLTLYNVSDGSIINSRDDQNVKDLNNVTIHATSGLLTWTMQAADNPIVGTAIAVGRTEEHRGLFEYAGNFLASPGKHDAVFKVENLGKVP